MAGPVSSTIGLVWKIVLGLIILGIAVAVLRAFNWDVFALIEWAWAGISNIVMGIADWLSGQRTFQQIVESR